MENIGYMGLSQGTRLKQNMEVVKSKQIVKWTEKIISQIIT